VTIIITDPETKILVVDDNPQYTSLLRRILGVGLGYAHIVTCESLDEAFALYDNDDPQFALIFVDYNFPEGRTGAEFLRFLNNRGISKECAVFLITAEPTIENQQEALKAGACGVVVKPFDRVVLKKQLEKAQQLLDVENIESF
jgi:CheY-like chemotaxis protein